MKEIQTALVARISKQTLISHSLVRIFVINDRNTDCAHCKILK